MHRMQFINREGGVDVRCSKITDFEVGGRLPGPDLPNGLYSTRHPLYRMMVAALVGEVAAMSHRAVSAAAVDRPDLGDVSPLVADIQGEVGDGIVDCASEMLCSYVADAAAEYLGEEMSRGKCVVPPVADGGESSVGVDAVAGLGAMSLGHKYERVVKEFGLSTGRIACDVRGAPVLQYAYPYHPIMLDKLAGEVPGVGAVYHADYVSRKLTVEYPRGLVSRETFDLDDWCAWVGRCESQFGEGWHDCQWNTATVVAKWLYGAVFRQFMRDVEYGMLHRAELDAEDPESSAAYLGVLRVIAGRLAVHVRRLGFDVVVDDLVRYSQLWGRHNEYLWGLTIPDAVAGGYRSESFRRGARYPLDVRGRNFVRGCDVADRRCERMCDEVVGKAGELELKFPDGQVSEHRGVGQLPVRKRKAVGYYHGLGL